MTSAGISLSLGFESLLTFLGLFLQLDDFSHDIFSLHGGVPAFASVALSSHRQVLLDFSQATLAVGRGLMQRRSVNSRYTQTLISEFNLKAFPLLHKSNVWQRGKQLTLVSLNTSFPVSKFYLDSSQQCR